MISKMQAAYSTSGRGQLPFLSISLRYDLMCSVSPCSVGSLRSHSMGTPRLALLFWPPFFTCIPTLLFTLTTARALPDATECMCTRGIPMCSVALRTLLLQFSLRRSLSRCHFWRYRMQVLEEGGYFRQFDNRCRRSADESVGCTTTLEAVLRIAPNAHTRQPSRTTAHIDTNTIK